MTFVMHHRTVAEFACLLPSTLMVLPGPQPGEERLIEGTLRLLDMPRPPRSRRRRVDVWLTVSGWAWTAYFAAFAFALWMLL
jgi:hypothetical protein